MKHKITMKSTHELFITLLNSNVILPDFTFYDMLNATNALEKQVPMKVTDERYCPNCNEAFFDSWQHNYCPVCGQSLDWSDEE